MAAGARVTLPIPSEPGRPELARKKSGELKVVEIDALRVGMSDAQLAGGEVTGDKKRGFRIAIGALEHGAWPWNLLGVGTRPAAEPSRRAVGRLIRTECTRGKHLFSERLIQTCLPVAELAADLGANRVRRAHHRCILARQKLRSETRPYPQAHHLPAKAFRHVDSDYAVVRRHRGSAAHPGIERAGTMAAIVVAALEPAVVGALDDGEADV